jgi:hypothetical protein
MNPTFTNMPDATAEARRWACAECESTVEAHLLRAGRDKMVEVRCVQSKGQHKLARFQSAVQIYRETGVGDALVRQQAERQDERRAKKLKEGRA